ncbi:unnamed protein product [Boreogadus saida]
MNRSGSRVWSRDQLGGCQGQPDPALHSCAWLCGSQPHTEPPVSCYIPAGFWHSGGRGGGTDDSRCALSVAADPPGPLFLLPMERTACPDDRATAAPGLEC